MLCLSAGALTAALALNAFTLSWVHSVQKTEIQEDWRVEAGGLRVIESRIKGSAAGYDPPADSVLRDGWWRYDPRLPPMREVRLARSGAVADWQLCADGFCKPVSAYLPPASDAESQEPLLLSACDKPPG